jgi:hypothetical protein
LSTARRIAVELSRRAQLHNAYINYKRFFVFGATASMMTIDPFTGALCGLTACGAAVGMLLVRSDRLYKTRWSDFESIQRPSILHIEHVLKMHEKNEADATATLLNDMILERTKDCEE